MNTIRFDPKRSTETEVFGFEFKRLLASGESITTAVVTAQPIIGADVLPSAMIQGSAVVAGSKVSQKITGGVAGVDYALICTVLTSLGQTLQLTRRLAIDDTL